MPATTAATRRSDLPAAEFDAIVHEYATIRRRSDLPAAEFDALVRQDLPDGATPAQWLRAARKAKVPCRRCAGTGEFITRVENGHPTGPGGICFRCGGKGHQIDADRRRNYGHDRHYIAGGIA